MVKSRGFLFLAIVTLAGAGAALAGMIYEQIAIGREDNAVCPIRRSDIRRDSQRQNVERRVVGVRHPVDVRTASEVGVVKRARLPLVPRFPSPCGRLRLGLPFGCRNVVKYMPEECAWKC